MSGQFIKGKPTNDSGAAESYFEATVSAVGDRNPLHVSAIGGPGSLLADVEFDYIAVTYPSGTQEVYTYKDGGSGGTTVAVITVNYVDSTKASVLNVART